MTLPTSGSISTDMIMNELRVNNPGRAYPLSLLDADVLAFIGKSGPPVVMPNDFYGKSSGPGPLTVTGINGSNSATTTAGAGSVSCNPSVAVAGGSGAKSFAWSFLSNPDGCTLANTASQSCTVSHTYAQNSNGSANATLHCVVSDSSGSKTVDNITATLQWDGNL